ncbi:helix-turn-helix domain-containing protein [Streptomyces sp. ISL-22]|uniref:helix-turn-helix domain-containing protein n=1 Tax=unclassified Streptomyces TaxID=2593676 RepID=UPI001BE76CA5|nr:MULTISPECIES: helix-turn-helix domain-containing protein [unclassified Streptomyces]MBT2423493.1 helix-turn-helix domain-containing protein [Streptomyces sp. ISL-24]MBT2432514.1 helix-turn-helix domain-containing protein [Streptomyces sp. ISL-22]
MHQPAIPPASAPTPHTEAALPRLYLPEEVAAVLGCSAWWVKDRARRRLIPFTRVGRAYRFSDDHLAEIIRMHEERPARNSQRTSGMTASAPQPPVRRQTEEPAPAHRLKARPPRRMLKSQYGTAA